MRYRTRTSSEPNASDTIYLNGQACLGLMESYTSAPSTPNNESAQEADPIALDHLLHSKSHVLRSKLEVLASEIYARLTMWNRNLARIDQDKDRISELLGSFTELARYHMREQQDVGRLRDAALKLESERRDEDVQCWRDVVMVMRDFLDMWDAHEQAKNRAIFLNHAGPTTEESL